ncbi:Mov34-domain-containing protein [Basidiobolus meristosporus CBS 931.73]|uniref:Mov34-domain-containing protein n=1 Tax=Basidiobolus meristosporus CBS 931.73 TaxID=1314790 RepID=A0A1Y1Y3E1_9FUNG|nr:Mov34-domain-containing protein [Basidiobolus meristosporus CBS 931.73]|eukprot:ORX92114.1 Mov34-domain-containing protein [Basidiobolus meristosporus CBS 931.73]
MPKHPGYKQPENRKLLTDLKKKCLAALDILEKIKPLLEERRKKYIEAKEKYLEAVANHNRQAEVATPARAELPSPSVSNNEIPQVDPNWSLAKALEGVDLSKKSQSNRHSDYTNIHEAYPNVMNHNKSDGFNYTPTDYHNSRAPPVLPAKPQQEYFNHPRNEDYHVSLNHRPLSFDYSSTQPISKQDYQKLPPKPLDYCSNPVPDMGSFIIPDSIAPSLPPKPSVYSEVASLPNIVSTATTECGSPLRMMHLPSNLMERFLLIAQKNTAANLETCGILSGTLKQNAFFITTLIIPKQTSTSDTCTTTNEEELFSYQDENDLMTLGWIHTHPTQTCFMSSVDVHTHCSYQLMLPEAIAVVCAPKHEPSTGIFRLTDPPGLGIISQCRDSRLFHPHEGGTIYTDANIGESSHVKTLKQDFDIVDLRNIKSS